MQKFISPQINSLYLLTSFRTKTNDQIVISTHTTKVDAQEAKNQFIFEYLRKKNGDTLIKDLKKMNAFILKSKDSLDKLNIGYYAYLCPKKNFEKITVYSVKEVKKSLKGYIYSSDVLIKEAKKKFHLNITLYNKPLSCIEEKKVEEFYVRKDDLAMAKEAHKILNDNLLMLPVMLNIKEIRDSNRLLSIKDLKKEMPEYFSMKIPKFQSLNLGSNLGKKHLPLSLNVSSAIPIPPKMPSKSVLNLSPDTPLLKYNITNIHQQLAMEALEAFRNRQKLREKRLTELASAIVPGISPAMLGLMPKPVQYSSSV